MITTVCLNPCIDKSITVSGFREGGLNRAIGVRSDISGKGVNVAMALKGLGLSARCLGFNYADNAEEFERFFKENDISSAFVKVAGKLRTNTKILDIATQTLTEVNERGGDVTEQNISDLKELVRRQAADSEMLVMSGSVPGNVEDAIYRELAGLVRDLPVKVILDAEKGLLREGLKAAPFLIKPNLYELQTFFGSDDASLKGICAMARRIIEQGVQIVCVSMGKDGAVICSREEAWYAPGLKLEVRGVQGAGDSMVAGMCLAMKQGESLKEMLRFGMAAAAASLVKEGTQLCDRETFLHYLEKVQVEEAE